MSKLFDLLVENTAKYTQLLSDNDLGDEYELCKHTIQKIQSEIEVRKGTFSSEKDFPLRSPAPGSEMFGE